MCRDPIGSNKCGHFRWKCMANMIILRFPYTSSFSTQFIHLEILISQGRNALDQPLQQTVDKYGHCFFLVLF